MVCIPWKLLFVNAVAPALHLDKQHLPLGIWMILLIGVVPLAAASYHLVEWPARRWMRRLATKRPQVLTSVA
jgi:peptidoglycan/LPS O-acetylase OafA/YrhL